MNRLKRGIIAGLALISMVSVGTLDTFAKDTKDTPDQANFSISGYVYLDGRAWKDDEKPVIEMSRGNNNDTAVAEGSYKEGGRRFSPVFGIKDTTPGEVDYTFNVSLKDMGYKSIIQDKKVYVIYVKSGYNGPGQARSVTYSLDDQNFTEKLPEIIFRNTYFTKTLNVTREDGDGEYDLYTYTSGQPSMNNATKTLVKALNTVNGSLSEQLEEGKYFLKETKAPAGYEVSNTIYDFEVSAANYQQPQEFNIKTQVKKEEPDKGEEPEVKPEDPKEPEDKPLPDPEVPEVEPKPEVPENPTPQQENPTPVSEPDAPKNNDNNVPTGDHTNTSLYIALLALSTSLAGIMVFRKRNQNA